MATEVVDARNIDRELERTLAALLSRAYTDQRHLESYSEEELTTWGPGLAALPAGPLATMPRGWLGRFPTMRNVWRARDARVRSVHFIERDVETRVIGHVGLFEHEFRIGDEPAIRVGFIEDVATSPAAAGRGVASNLLRGAAEWAASQGFEVMGLSTGIPKFYERLGWVVWRGRATYTARNGDDVANEGTMVLGLTASGHALLERTQGEHLRGGVREGE